MILIKNAYNYICTLIFTPIVFINSFRVHHLIFFKNLIKLCKIQSYIFFAWFENNKINCK